MTAVKVPVDARLAPLFALRDVMPVPPHDTEERDERRILHRHDLKEAVNDRGD
jgi:hypothetical protein